MCLGTDEKLSRRVLGCIAFTLALFYKQMELYHSFAFFFVLIGWSLRQKSVFGKIFEVGVYGATVVGTSTAVLFPFLVSGDPIQNLGQILFRLFPIARGLFEDKVSNIWCTLHTVVKIRKHFDDETQVQIF